MKIIWFLKLHVCLVRAQKNGDLENQDRWVFFENVRDTLAWGKMMITFDGEQNCFFDLHNQMLK